MVSTVSSPSTAVNVPYEGGTSWSGVSNVLTSNDSYATASIAGGAGTALISASGFDFSSIPSHHEVYSIKVEVECSRLGGGSVAIVMRLSDGSGASTFYSAVGVTSVDVYMTDPAPDNWGDNAWLSLSRVKAAGFTVQFYFYNYAVSTQNLSVDHVRVTIVSKPPPTNVSAGLPSVGLTRPDGTGRGAAIVAATLPSVSLIALMGTASAVTFALASLPVVAFTQPAASVVGSAMVSGSLPSIGFTPISAVAAQGASASLPSVYLTAPEANAGIALRTPPDRIITVAGNRATDRTITVGINRVADRTINVS